MRARTTAAVTVLPFEAFWPLRIVNVYVLPSFETADRRGGLGVHALARGAVLLRVLDRDSAGRARAVSAHPVS